MQIKYRPDIDALRGIAVLLVVLFHAFPQYLSGGFIGVDIFFVISGYLITLIILNDPQFSILDFYNRRIRRLFPALVTVLISCLIIGWLTLYPQELQQLAKHVSYASAFILNFGLISEHGYFDIENHRKPLMHLWTLSIEEQFYLFWPLLILTSFTFLKTSKAALILLCTVVIGSFGLNLYAVESHTQTVFFHTLSRIWQIGLGAILAFNHKHTTSPIARPSLAVLGSCLIFLAIILLDENIAYPGLYGLMPCIGTLFILHAHANFKHHFGLIKLGLISYPLYLWHWVIFSFMYIYTGHQSSAIWMLAAILLSISLAFLTYRYIEKLRFAKNKSTPFILALLLATCLIASQFIIKSDGLANRKHIEYLKDIEIQLTRSEPTDAECIEHVKQLHAGTEPLFDYCRASMNGFSKTMAVIGDSHAHTLFEGLKQRLNKNNIGLVIYANSSCPSLTGFEWFNDRVSKDACQAKIKNIIDSIEKDSKISSVLISTRGPVYFHGEVTAPYSEENILIASAHAASPSLTIDDYISSLETTIIKLKQSSHINQIGYLLENPELGFSPRDSIRRPFDFFSVSSKFSGVNEDLYQLRMSTTFDHVQALANKHEFQVIETGTTFCNNGFCPAIIESKLAYADEDHLSKHGSKLIADKIIKSFLEQK